MALLPRFARHRWGGSFSDDFSDDFEGVEFSMKWLGLFLAVTVARPSRFNRKDHRNG